MSVGMSFRPAEPKVVVFTDASISGWGVSCDGQRWQEKWHRPGHHINWLEMRTVLVALQVLQFRLRRRAVRIWIDNSTTVAYLRKEGGTRSQALLRLSHRILKLAYDLHIRMYPQHNAGHLNVLADLASRTGQVIPSEWAVATPTFRWICESSPWGPPEVDFSRTVEIIVSVATCRHVRIRKRGRRML